MVIRLALLVLLLALPARAQDSLRLILPDTRPVPTSTDVLTPGGTAVEVPAEVVARSA